MSANAAKTANNTPRQAEAACHPSPTHRFALRGKREGNYLIIRIFRGIRDFFAAFASEFL